MKEWGKSEGRETVDSTPKHDGWMDAEKREREIVGHVGQKMRRRHKAPPMMGVDSVISFLT